MRMPHPLGITKSTFPRFFWNITSDSGVCQLRDVILHEESLKIVLQLICLNHSPPEHAKSTKAFQNVPLWFHHGFISLMNHREFHRPRSTTFTVSLRTFFPCDLLIFIRSDLLAQPYPKFMEESTSDQGNDENTDFQLLIPLKLTFSANYFHADSNKYHCK